jgi:hypothetical protein
MELPKENHLCILLSYGCCNDEPGSDDLPIVLTEARSLYNPGGTEEIHEELQISHDLQPKILICSHLKFIPPHRTL